MKVPDMKNYRAYSIITTRFFDLLEKRSMPLMAVPPKYP